MDIDKLIQVLEVAKALGVGSVYVVEAGFDSDYKNFEITGAFSEQETEALILLKVEE